MTPRSRRSGNARMDIVNAAIELFEKKGYESTSVQDVVERAGLTKGAFYHHFESKDELLLLIHDTFMDYELLVIGEILSEGLSPREALSRIIEEVVVSVEGYRPHITIFFEQRRFLSDKRFSQVKAKRDLFTRQIVSVIDRGIRYEEFKNVASSQILAFGIIGMCSWAYQWYRPGLLTAREVGRLYAAVVIQGLSMEDSSDAAILGSPR